MLFAMEVTSSCYTPGSIRGKHSAAK